MQAPSKALFQELWRYNSSCTPPRHVRFVKCAGFSMPAKRKPLCNALSKRPTSWHHGTVITALTPGNCGRGSGCWNQTTPPQRAAGMGFLAYRRKKQAAFGAGLRAVFLPVGVHRQFPVMVRNAKSGPRLVLNCRAAFGRFFLLAQLRLSALELLVDIGY